MFLKRVFLPVILAISFVNITFCNNVSGVNEDSGDETEIDLECHENFCLTYDELLGKVNEEVLTAVITYAGPLYRLKIDEEIITTSFPKILSYDPNDRKGLIKEVLESFTSPPELRLKQFQLLIDISQSIIQEYERYTASATDIARITRSLKEFENKIYLALLDIVAIEADRLTVRLQEMPEEPKEGVLFFGSPFIAQKARDTIRPILDLHKTKKGKMYSHVVSAFVICLLNDAGGFEKIREKYCAVTNIKRLMVFQEIIKSIRNLAGGIRQIELDAFYWRLERKIIESRNRDIYNLLNARKKRKAYVSRRRESLCHFKRKRMAVVERHYEGEEQKMPEGEREEFRLVSFSDSPDLRITLRAIPVMAKKL